MELGYLDITLRLLLATGIGWLIGHERKLQQKPAGARTHILVCLASCIVTMISAYGFDPGRTDAARLVVGVLTGIGFIGGGIIWKSPSGDVRGLTTATEIFLLAALGIAAGMGYYFLVAMATLITFVTLSIKHLPRRRPAEQEEEEEPAAQDKEENAAE